MHAEAHASLPSSPACYFSIAIPDSSTHFSVETPSTTPLLAYSPDSFSDPSNPLLAYRPLSQPYPSYYQMPSSPDASKVLQLQTQAAHSRPASMSPTNSSSGSSGSNSPIPANLCCCRCRRESIGHSGMVRFGTNLHYCNHCASMVGYSSPT